MVARPIEVSTEIHPYDVVPARSLGLPAEHPHGVLIRALLRAVRRLRVRRGRVPEVGLEPASEPIGASDERPWPHAA
jgi:hypothetical protein